MVTSAPGTIASQTRPVRLTITVDASFDLPRGVTGIGLVLQETDEPGRHGPIIACVAGAYLGIHAGRDQAASRNVPPFYQGV